MLFGSHVHHHTLSFSVSVHCIAVFLARVVLLVITSRFLYREGKKLIRERQRSQDSSNPALKKVVAYLSVWLPVRLMCPGLLLRLGKWTCGFTAAVLPEPLDIFNKAGKCRGFWLLYAWIEILLLAGLIVLIWNKVNWQAYISMVPKMLNHLGSSTPHRRPKTQRGWNYITEALKHSTSRLLGTVLGQKSSTTTPGPTVKKSTSRRPADNPAPDSSSDSNSTDIEDTEVVPRATVRRTRPKTRAVTAGATRK